MEIDYKNVDLLKQYITKFGKITPRYYTGVSVKNQKKLAKAIKRARMMALLPFVIKYDKDLSLSNLADKEEVEAK
jgi:small subunit ribosomal protein S18